jgi:Tol biopolymer transport system component
MYPAWAPDGRRIYYQRVFKARDGAIEDCATVERDLSSGTERELVRKPGFVCIPKLTPDGRHVVTNNADPARNSRVLRIMSVDGGESRELMSVPSEVKAEDLNNPNLGTGLIQPMVWARDPHLVVKRLGDRDGFLLNGKTPSELWLVPLTGGEPKKIGMTPTGFTSMAVSPDGRHIAYAVTDAGRATTEIWTLENFLPTQTSRK